MSLIDIFRRPPSDEPTIRELREALREYQSEAERYKAAQVSGDCDEARRAREALDSAAGAVGGAA
jgi:hypothetical protein